MADTILTGRGGHGTQAGASRYTLSDYFLILKFPTALTNAISGNSSLAGTTWSSLTSLESSQANSIISELGDDTLNSKNVMLIGGDDSYVGSISFNYSQDGWTVQGDPTGSWVHTKNRNRTGTCTLDMNQVAYKSAMLIKIFNIYYNDTSAETGEIIDGFDIYVTDRKGRKLMSAMDCYVANVPSMTYGSTPRDLQWKFNCGRIKYEDTI